MKVIIIEDDYIVADHLRMILKENGVEVLNILDHVEDAIKSIKLQPDLYFVDIRLLGDKSGIDFGYVLKEKNIPFVYLTANNELETLKKAADSQPLSYITKPYSEIDIVAFLEIYKSKISPTYEVKTSYGKKMIKISEILYFEADGSNVLIVTRNNKYLERNTITDLEKQFEKEFIRVHRSFLVSRNKITQFNSTTIFIDDVEIPISRSYKNVFLK